MQARQSMQPAHVAFELAPREKAAYMKRELGPGQSEEDGTTLGGALPASLRSWLRQVIFLSVLSTPTLPQQDGSTLGGAQPASLRAWLRQVLCPPVAAGADLVAVGGHPAEEGAARLSAALVQGLRARIQDQGIGVQFRVAADALPVQTLQQWFGRKALPRCGCRAQLVKQHPGHKAAGGFGKKYTTMEDDDHPCWRHVPARKVIHAYRLPHEEGSVNPAVSLSCSADADASKLSASHASEL